MIFFDLDGTLIDHKKAEILGVKAFYNKYSSYFDFSEELFYNYWHDISDKHFLRFLNKLTSFEQQRIDRIKELFSLTSHKLTEQEAEIKFKVYQKLYEGSLMPYEDVKEFLNSLKGERLGIISNGDFKQQILKIERIECEKYFDTIVISGQVGVSKPSLQIFQIAAERAKVKISDCTYIGDNFETDILSSSKAGMKAIWLNRDNAKSGCSEVNMIYDLKTLKF
jgi:putative hydrolase of the HAD superfamily